MSNINLMTPELFEKYRHLNVRSHENIYVKTGNASSFIVNSYIPLHLYNLAGDEVLAHFYCCPGLSSNPNVKILLGINATYAMGLKLSPQDDIIIKNTASPYEAVSDYEFQQYDLFKNLALSQHLFIGKNRDDLDYEFINMQCSHIKEPSIKHIVLHLLYQYPLIISTRNKMNISYVPDIFFDPEIRSNAVWPKQPAPIPLSLFHAKLVETEMTNYLNAKIVKLATDPSIYAAGIFCIDEKPPKHAPVDWKPDARLCTDFTIFNNNCVPIVEQIPNMFKLIRSLARFKYFVCIDVRQAYHHIRTSRRIQKYLRCITHDGKIYIWLRMPFGPTTAPSYWNLFFIDHIT